MKPAPHHLAPALLAAMMVLPSPAGMAADTLVQKIPGVYEAKLSGWCKSITEMNAVSGNTGDFRVRRGASLTANGNRHRIVVEAGAEAHVTGIGSTVFVAKGGRATVGGQRNQVFAENGGRVVILGKAMVATVEELIISVNANAAEECR